jgi:hypothetical protein
MLQSRHHEDTDETRQDREILQALREASEADSLEPRRRVTVLDAAGSPRSGWLAILLPPVPLGAGRALAGAAAMAAVALLATVSLLGPESALEGELPATTGPEGPAGALAVDVPAPAGGVAAGLQVTEQQGAVILHWSSPGDRPHRVVRATDPRQLDSAPAEVVHGDTWVDPNTNGSRIVFYRVEEL